MATALAHPNLQLCAYIKVDGTRCGSPAWQDHPHCYHHHGLKQRFASATMSVPPLDDQNSIQVALMDVINALLSKRIDRADAYTVIYAIQTARANLKGLTLVPPTPDMISAIIEQRTAVAIEKAKAELREEFELEHASDQADYDANGEPTSLAAILLKELRDSAGLSSRPEAGPFSPGEPPSLSSRPEAGPFATMEVPTGDPLVAAAWSKRKPDDQ